MKKNTANKMKLGVFVSFGLALLIAGIYFVGQKQQLFNPTFRVSGVFKDINGLQIGNNVRFAGINIGTIDDIVILSDTAIRIDMLLNQNTQKFIKTDASANIGSDGLMGNKILIISPGNSGQMIQNNGFIKTHQSINMEDIMIQLERTAENAAKITDDLSQITGNIRSGKGTIGKLFMDTAFAKNIDQSIINIKEGTGGFKQNMDAAKNSFLLRRLFKNKKDKKDKKTKDAEEEKKEEK